MEKTKSINDFYNLSIEFSKYIQEQVISESSIDKLMVYLMRLYVAAIELPNMEVETKSNDDSQLCPTLSFSEDFETFYWSIFDPFNNNPEEEVVCMNLFDDLTTVLDTLQSGISEYEAGRIGNAVFDWKFEFEGHTGTHIVNALKALHAIKLK